MITKLFSVFDSKAAVFSTPFFMPNQGMAIRAFIDIASDAQTMIYKHPEDFSLFCIGEFDDETGAVREVIHQNLGTAASYRRDTWKPELTPQQMREAMAVNGSVERVNGIEDLPEEKKSKSGGKN